MTHVELLDSITLQEKCDQQVRELIDTLENLTKNGTQGMKPEMSLYTAALWYRQTLMSR
jgi:hypothetical protein